MKKLLIFVMLLGLFPINTKALDLSLKAKSAILIDQNTGEVLYSLNEHEKRPMASMTKIMSLLLIMEKIDDGTLSYDDEVVISDAASSMGGSQMFFQTGDKYKVKELLKCIAMASANDAVVALAEQIYGSEAEFINKMNEKVKALGLQDTNFENVHGLDSDNHYSSSYDMAFIARELLKHEDILNFTKVYEEYLKRPDGSEAWLVNTNKLVRFYEGVDGLKTGYTSKAGYCLTATIKKENLRLISVVMGEENTSDRSSDTVKLINFGFNNFKVNLIKSKDEVLGRVNVIKGKKDEVEVVLKNDAIKLLKLNETSTKYHFDFENNKIVAPVKKGDVVGKAKIYDEENNLIIEADMTVKEDVLKANILDLFMRNLKSIVIFN